jgi:hypothetical protein
VAYETHEFDTDAEEVDAEEVVEEKPEEPEEAQDPGLDEEQHLPYGIDMPIEGDDSNSDEELNESKRPQLELRDRGGECLSSHLSNSTILNISLLDDDEQFNEITLNTPHDDDMLSVDELKGERMPRQAQISTTWTFFFRITYRFGQSLRQLREEMQAISLRLGDQDVKRANGHFLKRSIEFWLDDAAERPNRPEKNPASFPKHKLGDPLHRVTPKYRDIVQAIDPELVKEHDLSEIQCADIVRKAIITEAYYNRSVPSPVRLPSFKPDSQGTQEGDRLRMDRSCIWSFGDPRIKGRAGKRWLDVNRWPPQAQSAETWREICRRGDERSPLNLLDTEADSTDEEDDFEAKELRHYVGGRTLEGDGQGGPSRAHYNNMLLKPLKRHGESHYWQGDTELQKAVVNDRMRLRE